MTRKYLSFQNIGLVYLGSPFVLFHLFWLELWFSVPILAATFIAYRFTQRHSSPSTVNLMSASQFGAVIAISISIVWAFFAGYFGFVFGWAPDWNQLRADYLSTFASFDWPIKIPGSSEQSELFLLSVPGLYLVPAGVSKVLGANLTVTLYLMAAWIIFGLTLVLQFILQRFTHPIEKLKAALLFVFFSGLDSVGAAVTQNDPVRYLLHGGHIEPWVGTVQFSSMTTLLLWVPHHSLSSWLGVALLDRAKGTPAFVGTAVSVVFLSFVWSTFSPIGLASVALLLLIWEQKIKIVQIGECLPLFAIFILGVLPIFTYYSRQNWAPRGLWWYFSNQALINFGIEDNSMISIVAKYVLFLIVELLVWLAIGVWLGVSKRELIQLVLMLLAISQVVSFGPSDFTMRVSIAPLFLLFVMLVDKLVMSTAGSAPRIRRLVVCTVCIAMSWTSISEFMERYRVGPSSLQEPCVISGCESALAPPQLGVFATSEKPLLFRD